MPNINKHLIAIAVSSAKDHILWEINNKQDSWDTPESKREYKLINDEKNAATKAYIADGGLVTNRSFTGVRSGELSHYEIDDAITKEFGEDRVCADSESGGFFAYTDVSVADELDVFLKDKFPGLEYSIHVNDDPRPLSGGGNWHETEKLLKTAGVTVEYSPVIPVPAKSHKEIVSLLDDASQSLLLTGLISEEEISSMLDKYRG